jgi:putative transposase
MQIMSVLKNENKQYRDHDVQQRTKQEIEECVTFVRLELYNRDLSCGPEAIRERLETFYHVKSLPSERTIARMLARNGLTHGRTGVYE